MKKGVREKHLITWESEHFTAHFIWLLKYSTADTFYVKVLEIAFSYCRIKYEYLRVNMDHWKQFLARVNLRFPITGDMSYLLNCVLPHPLYWIQIDSLEWMCSALPPLIMLPISFIVCHKKCYRSADCLWHYIVSTNSPLLFIVLITCTLYSITFLIIFMHRGTVFSQYFSLQFQSCTYIYWMKCEFLWGLLKNNCQHFTL